MSTATMSNALVCDDCMIVVCNGENETAPDAMSLLDGTWASDWQYDDHDEPYDPEIDLPCEGVSTPRFVCDGCGKTNTMFGGVWPITQFPDD